MFRITLERLPLRLDFEAGSVAEAVAILQEQDTALRQAITIADELAGNGEQPTAGEADKGTNAEPARRGRKPKNQPDPSTATAPPPVAVPPAAPATPAPELAKQVAEAAATGAIPEFLRAPAAAAPPPPPAPPAPPVAPSGILAGKVIANLDARKAGSPDGGKSLSDWLAQCGLVNPGESYDAAIAVVRMTTDDKLAAIAGQLGVS
jgi:hypothetical protein